MQCKFSVCPPHAFWVPFTSEWVSRELGIVFILVKSKSLFYKGEEYTTEPIKPKIFYCLALY